ncbi:MAG: thrombospondin type 3 repeat-containing protein [Deltaproteobacteria bacterium]|nr:thrombospondin type 3 repeat-containing protein [Deltaproteobacteria bacterium]
MKKKLNITFLLIAFLTLALPAQALTPVQVTSNNTADEAPQIYGDHIVWQGFVNNNREIFHYNISTGITTQITNNSTDDISPQTDGNYITWLGDGFKGILKYYDLKTGITAEIPNTLQSHINSAPRIANGYITWMENTVGLNVNGGEIYLFHIAAGIVSNISGDPNPGGCLWDNASPRINSDMVGWNRTCSEGSSNTANDLTTYMIYNIGTATVEAAPHNFTWPDSRQRSGSLSVYLKYDGADREVFLTRNNLISLQVTDNMVDDYSPGISGNTIVWVSGSGQSAEIFIASDPDQDGDGISDSFDNCPAIANPDQGDDDNDGIGNACDSDPDIDGDGVDNGADLCAETPQGEIVDPGSGCSIAQLVPCEGPVGTTAPWKNHGKYVSGVAKTAKNFVELALITESEKGAIVSAAASSSCGN